MSDEITDINVLVAYITKAAIAPIFDDEIWQCYGYKKRPKYGSVLVKFFPKLFRLKEFISKQILIMGIIDVINAINKSSKDIDTKTSISVGVIDKIIFSGQDFFDLYSFLDNDFLPNYKLYQEKTKIEFSHHIILAAKQVLSKNEVAKVICGTAILLDTRLGKDLLIKSDFIKKIVNASKGYNPFNVSLYMMSNHTILKNYVTKIKSIFLEEQN
jgi:hypothetical protein